MAVGGGKGWPVLLLFSLLHFVHPKRAPPNYFEDVPILPVYLSKEAPNTSNPSQHEFIIVLYDECRLGTVSFVMQFSSAGWEEECQPSDSHCIGRHVCIVRVTIFSATELDVDWRYCRTERDPKERRRTVSFQQNMFISLEKGRLVSIRTGNAFVNFTARADEEFTEIAFASLNNTCAVGLTKLEKSRVDDVVVAEEGRTMKSHLDPVALVIIFSILALILCIVAYNAIFYFWTQRRLPRWASRLICRVFQSRVPTTKTTSDSGTAETGREALLPPREDTPDRLTGGRETPIRQRRRI